MSPLPKLPARSPHSHKGDFGRALLIGGSRGMAGAIALAGMACLRSGAGLVKLAVPATVIDTVAAWEPSYTTASLSSDLGTDALHFKKAQREVAELLPWATAVAIGPGLGRGTKRTKLVQWVYETCQHPLVCDADALNGLAESSTALENHAGPRILTPHPGEFARLTGIAGDSREAQIAAARSLAAQQGLVILLKGHRTFITDGTQEAFNTTGNPGMATGGTGDVLTGIITALLCQGLSPLDAAVLGAHVHGLAGDLAAAEVGQVSLIATDLPRFLPQAFLSL